ncbi:hypothetical protein BCR41DRAFT_389283 [Lobosporangium transversale]|uniref:Uncharacterized protein n=1 Tax=Lobosporangium transversale TaxID=64571 RepID=A0A1Y2GBM7_9FUNG|nr:hypothetical protein BCR41DRAFT_389283 [Lobosporangium transversale]ORZ06373.1 hypothetical protein BCR41DRAFT_389283 [Lobosporangium transversale]|eukprot:XP_021877536.1 hypothetical protein BCR41DRAFT_389283 [Lobosporangium transversale]
MAGSKNAESYTETAFLRGYVPSQHLISFLEDADSFVRKKIRVLGYHDPIILLIMAPYAWIRFICTQTDIEDRTKACCQLILVLDAQGVDFPKTLLDAPHDLRTSPYPTPRISLEGAHIVLQSVHIFLSYGLPFCPCFFFLSTRFPINMYSQVVRCEKILYLECQGPSYINDGFVFHLCMDNSAEDVVIERTEEI